MKEFKGKMAVGTGGGAGMGREIVCQLVGEGAHVAMCDVSMKGMEETVRLANPESGVRLTSHICDVSVESDMIRFREEVETGHQVHHINLLFNNAGISITGEFVNIDRARW